MIRTAVALASSSAVFVASSAPFQPAPWEQWLLQGGSFAVLVFVVLRLITKALPELEEINRKQSETHQAIMGTVVTAFTEEVRKLRQEHNEHVEKLNIKIEERDAQIISLIRSCNNQPCKLAEYAERSKC